MPDNLQILIAKARSHYFLARIRISRVGKRTACINGRTARHDESPTNPTGKHVSTPRRMNIHHTDNTN
jgi:hypothetical protein